MFPKFLLAMTFMWATGVVRAGYSTPHLTYGAGFKTPQAYAYNSNFGTPYAAAWPVAPTRGSGTFSYNGISYSAPSFVKLRGGNSGFDCGPLLRSRPKFAFPAPIPPVYDAPLPVDDGSSDVNYSDFEEPHILVKFGPPITTTTTTYSTSAAGAGVHVKPHFKATNGW